MTYREAGVDLDAADAVVGHIKGPVTATWHDGVIGGFGGFAAGIELPAGYVRPILMMSTDGVGTKAELARQMGHIGGLGWDLVAMCIDDLVAAGATPIAMTDYIAVGRIETEAIGKIVGSIAAACAAAGVALLGGETAEHPGVMEADTFDLAGAALGVVEYGRQIDGSGIQVGDVVIGLESPNLRSNGFSLVRMLLEQDRGSFESAGIGDLAATLLEPSVLYTPAILGLLEAVPVHGLAHVTGGGLPGNITRIVPPGCDVVVDTSAWTAAPVFDVLTQISDAGRDEMFRTFNMGIGFVAVVPASSGAAAVAALNAADRPAAVVGEVVPGTGAVRLR